MDKFNLCYGILRWSMDAAVCIDFESDSNEDFAPFVDSKVHLGRSY